MHGTLDRHERQLRPYIRAYLDMAGKRGDGIDTHEPKGRIAAAYECGEEGERMIDAALSTSYKVVLTASGGNRQFRIALVLVMAAGLDAHRLDLFPVCCRIEVPDDGIDRVIDIQITPNMM